MGEILFWTFLVFAVLGLPPLLAAWLRRRPEGRSPGHKVRHAWPGLVLAAAVL